VFSRGPNWALGAGMPGEMCGLSNVQSTTSDGINYAAKHPIPCGADTSGFGGVQEGLFR